MKLKQLFCFHVNKTIKSEFLERRKEKEGVLFYPTYDCYADTYKCLKCSKETIKERKVLVI